MHLQRVYYQTSQTAFRNAPTLCDRYFIMRARGDELRARTGFYKYCKDYRPSCITP